MQRRRFLQTVAAASGTIATAAVDPLKLFSGEASRPAVCRTSPPTDVDHRRIRELCDERDFAIALVGGEYEVGFSKAVKLSFGSANLAESSFGRLITFGSIETRPAYTIIQLDRIDGGQADVLLDRPLERALRPGNLATITNLSSIFRKLLT